MSEPDINSREAEVTLCNPCCGSPLLIACILDVILRTVGPLPAEDKLLLGSWAALGWADRPALLPVLLRLTLPPNA